MPINKAHNLKILKLADVIRKLITHEMYVQEDKTKFLNKGIAFKISIKDFKVKMTKKIKNLRMRHFMLARGFRCWLQKAS